MDALPAISRPPHRWLGRAARRWLPALFLFLFSGAAYAQFTYAVDSGTSVSITGYSGTGGALFIPQTINTSGTVYLPVTSIASGAFQNQTSLTSVSVPSTVVTIGSNAFFGCSALVAAYLDGNAPTTGTNAFSSAAIGFSVYYFNNATGFPGSLGNPGNGYPYARLDYTVTNGQVTITGYSGVGFGVILPAMINTSGTNILPVTSIGANAFSGGGALSSISIPGTVTSIGNGAFSGCSSLASLALPSGLTTIGTAAFASCSRLSSLTIPPAVTSIGPDAFYKCTSLATLAIPDSVTSLGDFVCYDCTGLSTVTFGAGLTSIGSQAFYDCTSLNNLTFPSNITTIGSQAFFQCTALTSVSIPASITTLGSDAFGLCTSVTAFTVDPSNPAYSSLNGVLFDKAQDTLIEFPGGAGGTYTIPAGVVTIGDAFSDNTNLTGVVIPGSVTTVGNSAFAECSALSSVTFGNGVNTIEAAAFDACTNLTSVTIPSSVTSIQDEAFASCSDLVSATFNGNAPSMGSGVFDGAAGGFTVYYYNGASGFTSPTWESYSAVDLGSPVAAWLQSNGYPSNANLQSTPNNDGVPLLTSYALDLDPTRNESGALPTSVVAGNNLSLTFFAGSVGVTYTVQTSTDLQNWTTSGVTVSPPAVNNFSTATIPITSKAAFMRVVLSY